MQKLKWRTKRKGVAVFLMSSSPCQASALSSLMQPHKKISKVCILWSGSLQCTVGHVVNSLALLQNSQFPFCSQAVSVSWHSILTGRPEEMEMTAA